MGVKTIDLLRTEGDTSAPLKLAIKTRTDRSTTTAVDLNGLTVYLYIRAAGAAVNLSEFNGLVITASVSDATNGLIDHTLTTNQATQLVEGTYYVKVKTTDGSAVQWYPNDALDPFNVKSQLILRVSGAF
jgi:hypothetical protein